MGGRLLRRWLSAPLIVLPPLLRRQEAVAALVEHTALRLRLTDALAGIGDIDRLVCRAHNQHAAEKMYGRGFMEEARAGRRFAAKMPTGPP